MLIKSIRTFQLKAVGLKKALEDFIETQVGLLQRFIRQDEVADFDYMEHRLADGQTDELRLFADIDRNCIRV